MTATIHLVSNSAASTCRFWSAIFDAPAVLDRPGRWRIVGPEGFAVTVTEAAVVEAITRVDLTVTAAPGAARRLRGHLAPRDRVRHSPNAVTALPMSGALSLT